MVEIGFKPDHTISKQKRILANKQNKYENIDEESANKRNSKTIGSNYQPHRIKQ